MMQVEQVDSIPKGIMRKLTPLSQAEYKSGKDAAINKRMDGIWMLKYAGKPVLLVGVIRLALMAPPYLWILMFRDIPRPALRKLPKMFTEMLLERYPIVTTFVNKEKPEAENFARFVGMQPSGEFEGYKIYRASRWHS